MWINLATKAVLIIFVLVSAAVSGFHPYTWWAQLAPSEK